MRVAWPFAPPKTTIFGAQMASLRLCKSLFHRSLAQTLHRGHLGPSRGSACTLQRSCVSTSTARRNGDEGKTTSEQRGLPLDPEWVEMAKKQLKGADPAKRLTWRTPEVWHVPVTSTPHHTKCNVHSWVLFAFAVPSDLAAIYSRASMWSLCTQQTIQKTWRKNCLANIHTHVVLTPQCTHRGLGPSDRYIELCIIHTTYFNMH